VALVAVGDAEMLDDSTENVVRFPALRMELLDEMVELLVAALVDSETTVTVIVLFWL
jgi:hypothetical protein